MDHEFSSGPMGANQIGWDWMCLQLLDGRDVMIYRLRDSRGADRNVVFGTIQGADGPPEYLDKSRIKLVPSELWTSPVTRARYPLHWHVEISSSRAMGSLGAFDVRPILVDQEMLTNLSSGANYYEGASEARDAGGKLIGRGYLEMTGYERPLPSSW
jgi:predicted secreted hydrolase